jgi:hypothetical protein
MQSKRFDYVKYDEKATADHAGLKEAFLKMERLVETSLEPGRAKALILTKLEEAFMWVGKAIRDEQVAKRGAELQEGRSNT